MNNGFPVASKKQCEVQIVLQNKENGFPSTNNCEFICVPEEHSEIEIIIGEMK